ncbi:CPBP family intramembrane metalloprotease [bacterium]|nr:CPBP family intramembrane metalloprotease [bacterium]
MMFDQNDPNQSNQEKPYGLHYPISGMDVIRVIAATLLILFAGFVVVSIVGYMYMAADGTPPTEEELTTMAEGGLASLPFGLKALAMVVQALLVVPAVYFLRKRDLSIRTYLRIHPVPTNLWMLSIGVGVTIGIIGDEISRIVNMFLPMPEDMLLGIEQLVQLNSVGDVLTMGLTVALIAPIGEELLFRGFFQRYFEAKRGVTSGVLTASAIFAAYHFNVYWLIPILLMATVMGAMAWRTESILPSIVVHATNNTASLVAANLMTDEPSWYSMGDHVSPLILLPAIILLVLFLRSFFRQAERLGLGGHGPHGDVGTRVNEVI